MTWLSKHVPSCGPFVRRSSSTRGRWPAPIITTTPSRRPWPAATRSRVGRRRSNCSCNSPRGAPSTSRAAPRSATSSQPLSPARAVSIAAAAPAKEQSSGSSRSAPARYADSSSNAPQSTPCQQLLHASMVAAPSARSLYCCIRTRRPCQEPTWRSPKGYECKSAAPWGGVFPISFCADCARRQIPVRSGWSE